MISLMINITSWNESWNEFAAIIVTRVPRDSKIGVLIRSYRDRTVHLWPQRYPEERLRMVEYNHNSHIKGPEESFGQSRNSPHFLSFTWLSQEMPATIIPGFYRLQFGLEFSDSTVPPPKPKYLTNNGEGNQLTVEEETASNQVNQEVS